MEMVFHQILEGIAVLFKRTDLQLGMLLNLTFYILKNHTYMIWDLLRINNQAIQCNSPPPHFCMELKLGSVCMPLV